MLGHDVCTRRFSASRNGYYETECSSSYGLFSWLTLPGPSYSTSEIELGPDQYDVDDAEYAGRYTRWRIIDLEAGFTRDHYHILLDSALVTQAILPPIRHSILCFRIAQSSLCSLLLAVDLRPNASILMRKHDIATENRRLSK